MHLSPHQPICVWIHISSSLTNFHPTNINQSVWQNMSLILKSRQVTDAYGTGIATMSANINLTWA